MRTVSLPDAVALIPDGASLMIGGFMGVGTPERVVDEYNRRLRKVREKADGSEEITQLDQQMRVLRRGIGRLIDSNYSPPHRCEKLIQSRHMAERLNFQSDGGSEPV